MSTPRERAQRTIDSVFGDQGVAATYMPPGGGSTVDCVVILDAEDERRSGIRAQTTMQGRSLEVRVSEVAAPAQGGVFETEESESFKVATSPRHTNDPERLVWRMIVRSTSEN